MEGVKLPRAIGFCCALYSLGIPPELLGMDALTEKDLDFVRDVCPHFDTSMRSALQFMNPDILSSMPDIAKAVDTLSIDYETDESHREITSYISSNLRQSKDLGEFVLRAANQRGFLG